MPEDALLREVRDAAAGRLAAEEEFRRAVCAAARRHPLRTVGDAAGLSKSRVAIIAGPKPRQPVAV